MKGRTLSTLLVFLLVLALGAQALRWRHRSLASRTVQQVELLSEAALAYGRAPVRLMEDNLAKLDRVAAYDPVTVELPIARGTQYLFLAQPEDALRWYRAAMDLEPRPETYLHIGRCLWLLGRRDEAHEAFAAAIRLNWRLASELPEGAR